MKTLQWTTRLGLIACGVVAFTAQAQQQPTQTAEGAQRFLAALAKKGNAYAWLVDAQGRTNHVQGKSVETVTEVGLISDDEQTSQKVVQKQLGVFSVVELDSQGPDGKTDACMTRIAKWQPREPLFESRSWQSTDEGILVDTVYLHKQETTYELSPPLASPQWIDWRNIQLSRAANGSQMTVTFAAQAHKVNLMMTGENELMDRVEYAMKFLKMSCDDTAATGF